MSLDDLVSINITATTTTPTAPGFGTPLVAAYHAKNADRVREYASLAGLVADGFAVTDNAYLALQSVFSQNPRPKTCKLGRRALPFTQKIELTCLDATQGSVYTLTVGGTLITYTVLAAATTSTVATALALLLAALPGVASSAAVAAVITTTLTVPGVLLNYQTVSPYLKLRNITLDPGIATDLAAIFAADANWYGLALDSNSKAEVVAAAAWVEANNKLFVYDCADWECTDVAVTTDVMSTLKASSYVRTVGLYCSVSLLSFAGAAWLGNRLSVNPGSDTWMFKTLAGVPADSPLNTSTTRVNQIKAKNGNAYVTIAGINMTQYGVSASGQYVDTTRFIDWLKSTMQIAIFTMLANSPKIPYTDSGADQIRSAIDGVLTAGVRVGGLAKSPAYSIFIPNVADESTADKGIRNLNGVTFQAVLAGAIHTIVINGTLTLS